MKTDIHPIYFEDDSFHHLVDFLKDYKDFRILVLVDENTNKYCLPQLLSVIDEYTPDIIEIQSGEIHKNLQTCQIVWNRFLSLQAGRKTLMINLGGGVISDLGGFVASIYKRGIPFIHIPTTLLASVDAAVGGKTGIDYRAYKNQLGVFSNPQAVFINPHFFNSLEDRQLKVGYAEMLKHGLIADADYWKELSANNEFSEIDWRKFIERSLLIKSEIVTQDPYENGLRKLLNFGHTFGHAFESFSLEHHENPLMHGEAVALGIMAEVDLSVQMLDLKKSEAEEITNYLKEIYPIRAFFDDDIDELIEFMNQDKKNFNDSINFSLIQKIGEGIIDQIYSVDEVRQCLTKFIHRNN